jgi:hypothetical protein
MTISSTTVKNSYLGNGTLDTFNYTFKIFANSDLQVIIRSSLGTETVKTLTTHYTVTGAGSASGGTIVFTAGNIPSATETVVIRRAVPQTQAIDYIANDPFPAESHEEGLDRSMMAIQQIQEEVDRSIKISRTNTMSSTEFTVGASNRAGKILGFDSAGELVVSQELGSFQGNWSSGETYAARDIVKDTSNGNIYLCNTGHTSSGAEPISTNTDSAKWDLLVDAETATSSATAAASSASAAATSASNAATSESNASTSASNASTSASNASASATAAANSYDSFDDRYLGAKASDPTLDNDSNALIDGALYFDTTNNVMKVYDLGTTSWKRTTPTSSEQSAIDTVSGISANVTTVAGISGNVTTVAGNNANITAVAGNASNINTVAGNNANITTVAGQNANITTLAGISADITTVATNSANISTIATDIAKVITTANDLNEATSEIEVVANAIANVDLVGTNIANVNSVGGSIANVNTVASNIADVNSFANTYRIAASAPVTSLDVGDLYFDTTANELKVYKASGWSAAGSTVNGTSARFTYNITGTPSSVSGADANGNTLAYDAGFADVYVNGVRMSASDITITSGTSVVFATALSDGDVVDVVAYGTFSVAAIDASNITSGTLNSARLPTVPTTKGGTGLTTLGSAGQALKVNSGGTALEFGDVSVSLSYTKGTFTGDNSTTAFTIDSGRAVDDVLVYVNGFLLTPTSDYTISGTTLTFTTAPATSAEIVVRYLPLNNSGVYTNDTATGDNSTTAFTIDSGRTVEDIIVTVNGVTLVPATDYTISGTTLTFTTAPTTSAEISIRYLRLT